MKKTTLFGSIALILFLSLFNSVYSNGVSIVNAATGVYLKLTQSNVLVNCESQVSVVTGTQYFLNNLGTDQNIKYAFPLPEGASAIGLRWKINGTWYIAQINPNSQDTGLPGGNMNANLRTHLGSTPLFFTIPQTVKKDSVLIIELKYVKLLPYSFGNVAFAYPNDYHLIQTAVLSSQILDFNLSSPRTIDSIRLLSTHPVTEFANNGNTAHIRSELYEVAANQNYSLKYSLNLNQLGLYSYSTKIPQNQLPDSLGGFFTFIAEPDPGTNQVIKKTFTLIVDRSGSMSGNKIIQARDASKFIVNNLNEGDKFNIVDFSDNASAFRNSHVNYTNQSRDSAISYINSFQANGLTNISGAFSLAVPQFSASNDSSANIIIFFTDGQPTAGITNTTQLLAHIRNLIISTETNIFLYCFGIGTDVNIQLLTLMGAQNKGLAEFLGNDELYSRITDFYLRIRNPVLLSPSISFSPANVIEVYPSPLPNLYKGQQMIVSGRYLQAGQVTVTLSGYAFNHPVSYQYSFNRIDSADSRYQFLTKIWAKQKIEYLLILYYALNPNDPAAIALKNQIIQLSIAYGVLSPFTSYGSITGTPESSNEITVNAEAYILTGNYPNPFNPTTTIKLQVNKNTFKTAYIRIYNVLGQLVKIIEFNINGKGTYEIKWNGDLINGKSAPSGVYFYVVNVGDYYLKSKMVLLK